MSSFSGRDDCTDIVLEFIAGGVPGNPIGETRGNYNAYFGHVNASRDLGQFTLDQVYAFQDQMLLYDPRSTAIGRYQFLKRTLAGLQKSERLTGGTLFTRKLQDELAVQLLVVRGFSLWWRGQISDEEFAHRLSLEWASLPDPYKDGRSHYDGDKVGNHASTTLAAVYDMLDRARAAQGEPTAVPRPAPATVDEPGRISGLVDTPLPQPNPIVAPSRQPPPAPAASFWSTLWAMFRRP